MSRKQLTAGVLALVLGLVSRTTVAAPRSVVAQLRAIICCAEHCPKDTPRPPMSPRRCCFLDSSATDPTSLASATSLERPALVPLATITLASVAAPLFGAIARPTSVSLRAGPPRYLRTLQIRC